MGSTVYAFGPDGEDSPKHSGMHKRGERMMQEMLKELDLTTEQQEQIKAIHATKGESRKKIGTQGKELREKIKTELDKPVSDKVVLASIVDELTALQRERIQNRIDDVLAVKAILTPEQFKQMQHKIEIKKEAYKELKKMKRQHHRKNVTEQE